MESNGNSKDFLSIHRDLTNENGDGWKMAGESWKVLKLNEGFSGIITIWL